MTYVGLMYLISHCRSLGYGTVKVKVEDGKVVSKSLDAELMPMDKNNVDKDMQKAFHADYEAVKAFTLKEVGELKADLSTRDAYIGMADYMNLIHTLSPFEYPPWRKNNMNLPLTDGQNEGILGTY